MSKKETFEKIIAEVSILLDNHKVKDIAKNAILDKLTEMSSSNKKGASVKHPAYEENGVMMHFCRFHQIYEPEQNMVMSGGKSKGYCKASIARWTKQGKLIQTKESQVSKLLLEEKVEEAKALSAEITLLKEQRNEPESFNYEADWAEFNK